MQSRLTKTIIGAVIAVALAAAVSYGLISQQTADKIQTQANQSLQTGQGVAPGTPGTTAGQPAPAPAQQAADPRASTQPGPQSPASAPRQ